MDMTRSFEERFGAIDRLQKELQEKLTEIEKEIPVLTSSLEAAIAALQEKLKSRGV